MTIRTQFPHPVREIENIWIPLADGTRLAARIWLPANAEQEPVPALFEYLPYRKDDGTARRDARRQPYFAGHGYAAVRVDMRGSGDAGGILYDEYLKQEQDDALEVLAWIAAQPWCNGDIGMHGISWGGFNSLQVAARRPPQLKCLLVIGFTDDRYNDDVHYMGGCVLTGQMLGWSSVMFAANAAPPDPLFVGDRWRQMWFERMEKTPPFVEAWLSHQRRDAYWKHGSVGEDYSAINIPVYAVGGWEDSYNNSIPRLLAGLNGPRKGLIGPWSHAFPEAGPPGPTIGFLQESLRWWDHWLKGIDNGIMAEPVLRCWIQEGIPPAVVYAERPGRWVAEPSWPSPQVTPRTCYLNSNGAAQTLDLSPAPSRRLEIRGLQAHGLDSREWGSYGLPGDTAGNQQAVDGEALCFTSAPEPQAVDILGHPEVELELAADQPLALVAVRLCDVAPTGASALVTWGLLNLTHRHSHEQPEPLEPGRRYRVRLRLNLIGYQLPAGHRWRLALSPTYLRHAWPSPRAVTLSLFSGEGCRLTLPLRPPQAADALLPPFPPAEQAPELPVTLLRPSSRRQCRQVDVVSGEHRLQTISDDGRVRYPNGMEVDETAVETIAVHEGDPLSAVNEVQRRLQYQRGDWQVTIEAACKMTADAGHFYLSHHLEAYEGRTRVFQKSWTKRIARDLV